MIEMIAEVAKFADSKSDIHTAFSAVQFRKHSVRACNSAGGASAATDLEFTADVPAGRLLKVCKALPEAEITLVEDGDRRLLRFQQGASVAHLETIKRSGAARIDAPAKKAAWHEVHGLDEVDRVAWSASKDETRRHLVGIFLGELGMAATNGHSAAVLGTPGDLTELLGKQGVVVSPDMLKGLPQTVQVSKDGQRLFLAEDPVAGDYRVANALDVSFPPLKQVLAPTWKFPQMEVGRQELEVLIKQAKLADKDLVLGVEGQRLQVIVGENRYQGALSLFDFEASVGFEGRIPAGRIGVSNQLLLSAIQACRSETIALHLNPLSGGGHDPIGIVDGPYKALVMPLRL